jgi:hypothetical protein
MKQTESAAGAIVQLGTLLLATIDCALAPINAGSLLIGVNQWVSRLCLPLFAAWREF